MMTKDQNMDQEKTDQIKTRSGMKGNGFFTVINLLLLIGLIALYVLFFLGSRKKDTKDDVAHLAGEVLEGAAQVAYIRLDTLMAQYELAVQMREEFEQEQTRLENDLNRRQKSFQSEVEKFQRDIQAGTISVELAQAKEQQLMQTQQEIYQLNDSFSARLMQKEMEMNNELLNRITEFLNRYNKEQDFDYILGYSRGGGILFAKDQHDITNEVLHKLNEEYRNERKKK